MSALFREEQGHQPLFGAPHAAKVGAFRGPKTTMRRLTMLAARLRDVQPRDEVPFCRVCQRALAR